MNKKHINAIVYSSVFCIAYGSFFYHRYTFKHSIAESESAAKLITNATITTLNHDYIALDSVNKVAYNQPDASEKTPAFNNRKKAIARKETTRQQKITTHISSPAVYAYTKKSPDNNQIDTLQQTKYTRPVMMFTSTTSISYAQNNAIAESYNASIKTDLAGTNESNINNITTRPIDQIQAESDGSEFLPDGSSQQDLFTSQSKNPRVYTIKNYQTANISCAPGYDDSSSYAKLIRGLKGCP